MTVTCEVCQGETWDESYQDGGRELTLVCKGCGTQLLLGAEERKKGPFLGPALKKSSSQKALWFVAIGRTSIGPLRFSTLAQLWCDGVVNRDSLVWKANWDDWRPLHALWERKEPLGEGERNLSALVAEVPGGEKEGLGPSGVRKWFLEHGLSAFLVVGVLGVWGYVAQVAEGGPVEVALEEESDLIEVTEVWDREARGTQSVEFRRIPVELRAAEDGEPPSEERGAGQPIRPSETEIASGVKANLRSVMPCLEGARERGDFEEGAHSILLDWVINPGGEVLAPRFKGPQMLLKTEVSHCFETAMATWRFTPSVLGAPVVNYSFGPFSVHL